MKTTMLKRWFLVAMGLISLWPGTGNLRADDTTTAAPATAPAATPDLSFGVPQIVQLTQAQVGDGMIVAYIRNSGNSYGLDAGQIIYLRQQGVSDTVINAMLSQPKPPAAGPMLVAAALQAVPGVGADLQPVAVAAPTVSVYVIPDTATLNYNSRLAPTGAGIYSGPVVIGVGYGARPGGVVYHGGGRPGRRH
jgi:hypothetical protein